MKTSVLRAVGATAFAVSLAHSSQAQTPVAPEVDLIAKGQALAVAADCMACHTVPGSDKAYAGGYAIESPMGAIYSTNITPSKTAGIGNYTEAEFARAVRDGVHKDGSHLYPAMPYTSYAQLTNEDAAALYAYFMNGVTPVDEAAPRTALAFPFNLRASMAGWNLLFLDRRRFEPDPDKSQELNRGAYLVNALGHCGACHTPRNFLMAEKTDKALSGAMVGPWYAPNITSDEVSGIGAWRTDELIQYLRTGHARGKNQAAGGMAEAVQNSLQYLPAADLAAIAAYLKSTVPIRDPGDSQAAHAWGQPASDEAARRGSAPPNSTRPLVSGADLYSGYCASCHQADGAGSANQAYPALFNNTATGSTRPANLVAAILYGVDRSTRDGGHVVMPRFDSLSYVDPLTDEQIAAIANHVLIRYGNSAARVSDTDVAIARRGGPRPLLAQAQPFMAPALGVLLLLGVFSAVQWWRRTR